MSQFRPWDVAFLTAQHDLLIGNAVSISHAGSNAGLGSGGVARQSRTRAAALQEGKPLADA